MRCRDAPHDDRHHAHKDACNGIAAWSCELGTGRRPRCFYKAAPHFKVRAAPYIKKKRRAILRSSKHGRPRQNIMRHDPTHEKYAMIPSGTEGARPERHSTMMSTQHRSIGLALPLRCGRSIEHWRGNSVHENSGAAPWSHGVVTKPCVLSHVAFWAEQEYNIMFK